MEAVARYVTAPAIVIGDIGDLLSERHNQEKRKKRKILLSIQHLILNATGFGIMRRLEH